jgi:predicted nuclease of predicted toxin-antitoxin system
VKFKIDENLPVETAEVLRDAGFDAATVWDEALAGSDDITIASRVRSEDRILVTLDLDFANIRAYPPEEHPGFIVLRLRRQDKENAVAVMNRVTLALRHRSPARELWIVEEDRIRFRQGRPS